MKDMEDGEVELSDQSLISDPSNFTNLFQGSTSVDTFFDEYLKNMQTCTHTHACNPPGSDAAAHTHTCYHTHTQLFTSEEDDRPTQNSCALQSRRRPSGNREAVRKYREKKKAHTAYLEEEVKKLRVLNQQLVKKLRGHVLLEAEVVKLRSLLVDLRGKINTELGVVPFQKQICCSTTFRELGGDYRIQPIGSGTDLQCEISVPCLHPPPSLQVGINGNINLAANWEGVDCQAHKDDANMDANTALVSSLSPTE